MMDEHDIATAILSISTPGVRARLPMRAVRVGHLDGDCRDPRCTWLRHRQISLRGAILVRPDRFRRLAQHQRSPEPKAQLTSALARILCRTND